MIVAKNKKQEGRFYRAASNVKRRTDKGLNRSLYAIGKDYQETFVGEVRNGVKTGRIYIIRGRLHQASAPGETPANITGNYARSVGYGISGRRMRFGNSAYYAGFLEEGTTRMEPRPGLRNAIDDNERNTYRNIADGVLDHAGD